MFKDKKTQRTYQNREEKVRGFEERGIPFELKLPQEYEHWTSQAITDTEEDIRAGRISRPFKNVEDLMSSLDAD